MSDSPLPQEIGEVFRSLPEWSTWIQSNSFLRDGQYIQEVLKCITQEGVIDPLTGQSYPPNEVHIVGENLRETIRAGHLISRHRALLVELRQSGAIDAALIGRKSKIYAPEALTAFALYMRGRYPRFIGSEYAETEEQKLSLFPIPHQDLQALTFPDGIFDLVLSNDVFEHIPDLDKALWECGRILKPEGRLLSTFPFAFDRHEGIKKAVMDGATVEYLTEPEYHGNPMCPEKGSLVFEVPGWNLVERAKKAGFSDAAFVFNSSARHGILGRELAGVFVFCASKTGKVVP